jgi:hypothetical protein
MDVSQITTDRLHGWGQKLITDGATPAVLIGVRHGEASGQLVLVTVENLSTDQVVQLLRNAIRGFGRYAG